MPRTEAPARGPGLIDTGASTPTGLLIGLGLEYAVGSNWSTKLEYNYLGFGAKNINISCTEFVPGSCAANPTFVTSIGSQAQVIKVGINYKFW